MPEITNSGAINRHITEFLTTDKRVKQYKCKTLQNPDYYTPDGKVFLPIDVAFTKNTSTVNAGKIWLRDKSIVSVGTKQADDAYKIFGLRPDERQDGSEQFEVSIESIEINGKKQTINLRNRLAVSPITTKFGDNLYLQHARQRTRVMVEATNADEGFKIALRLHLTGLTVTYRADLDEYWIYNEQGQFRFRLGKPYLVDPATMNPIHGEIGNEYPQLVKHSLTEISKGEYLYVKEPTEAFGKVILPASFLIDADTVYSSTSDGAIWGLNADWATCRSLTTGSYCYTTDTGVYVQAKQSGANYEIDRTFFYHYTSGVVGTISSVKQYLFEVYSSTPTSMAVLGGSQADNLTTADFDAFGDLYGSVASWNNDVYNAITFNAAGVAGINQSGVTKICNREYAYDYLNSQPGAETTYRNGVAMADDTSGTKDPYLYITAEVAVGTGRFFQMF